MSCLVSMVMENSVGVAMDAFSFVLCQTKLPAGMAFPRARRLAQHHAASALPRITAMVRKSACKNWCRQQGRWYKAACIGQPVSRLFHPVIISRNGSSHEVYKFIIAIYVACKIACESVPEFSFFPGL